MYGWRGRLGLIVPSSNTTMEEEFRRFLPEGVSLHVARVKLRKVNVEELREMKKYVGDASDRLADAGVNLITYGCTTGSLVGGIGYDLKLTSEIEDKTGIPAIATATAVVEALKHIGARRISLATPYIEEVNERERKFLEDSGFEVVALEGLGLEDNLDIGKQRPEIAYQLGRSAFKQESDVLFISCTNFRTFEVLERLEADLKKPVISSNSATLWMALRYLGIGEPVSGLGSLLRSV